LLFVFSSPILRADESVTAEAIFSRFSREAAAHPQVFCE
jgi:hypothetical protein